MDEEYIVEMVPVDQVEAGDNDREKFDPVKLQSLADSIARDGLTSPITLVPIGNGRYRIAAGERRFRAISQLLKWEFVPAFVRPMDAARESAVMLHENVGRVDLNPIEQGRGYEKRAVQFSWSNEEIAERAGTTVAHVVARRNLLRLVPEAQELVARGVLPVGHAEELAIRPVWLQREALKLLGKTAVPFITFKQYLVQLEANHTTQLDLTALFFSHIQQAKEQQASMRGGTAVIYTSQSLPQVVADKKDTAGDILTRYMQCLMDGGFEQEAAAVGNALDALLKLRKVKNFREGGIG